MQSPFHAVDQIAGAYRAMAERARYRPQAPSDGFGHITVPLEELDLDAEARAYAVRWLGEERQREFWIGCPDWHTAVPMVWAVEAARLMCGGPESYEFAIALLEMASERMRTVQASLVRREARR